MYRSVAVNPSLRPYVRQVLVEDSGAGRPTQPAPYTVLPRPYPTLGFQYRGRLDVLRGPGARSLDRSGITGLQSSFRVFVPRSEARSILVFLAPDGAYALFGGVLDEITDEHVGLRTIASRAPVCRLEERLAEASSLDQRSQLAQAFLADLLERSQWRPHPIVTEASRRILRGHGAERIGALSRDLGVSERYLERLFRSQVGVSPKRLASLARFDYVRVRIARRPSIQLALQAGYADQAHFVRSFKAYSGLTPSRYQPDPSAP